MDNLLYYPYINLPETDWTARALLYYDKVASIVPQRFFYKDYDEDMRRIVDDGLIEPINPMKVISRPREISDPFIEYLNSKKFKLRKRQESFKIQGTGRIEREFSLIKQPRIHCDKFDQEIFYQLEQMGLAIPQKNGMWYYVEKNTANELMMFLASVIAKKLNYLPATDQDRKRFRIFESKKEFRGYRAYSRKRDSVLNELIPFPEKIDLSKLRRFKDQYLDLLIAFRNRVELIVFDNSIEPDTPLFAEKIKELIIRKEELAGRMVDRRLGNVIFGTVRKVVGPVISASTAGGLGKTVLAVPGLANDVYSALKDKNNPESIFDQSGTKYLALIDKKVAKPI